MTEYVHLVGAEQVQIAARTIQSAADEMRQAAFTIENAVHQLRGILQDHQIAMADFADRMEKLKAQQ